MYEKLMLLAIIVFICILVIYLNNRSLPLTPSTFLALGDSYTIGEGVAIYESFSYQTVQLLRKAGHSFNAPEMVAKTGWTTGDLNNGIKDTVLQSSYDVVSLLIGVNNQYRKLSLNEYALEFEQLIRQAIRLAADKPDHVFVFSIPNWSVTPFAKRMSGEQLAGEIDAFNHVNEDIARQYHARYLSITWNTRDAASDESLLTADALHPSGKEYARWANLLAEEILRTLVR
ncbi:MAG: SGNH/GDSL hydrolase family protein [Chitinophagaceae bacterium]